MCSLYLHAICSCVSRLELSAAEVHRRLQAGAQKQQSRQHRLSATAKRPSPRSKSQQRATPSKQQQQQAAAQAAALVSSQGHLQQSPPASQQQQQQEGGRGSGSSGAVAANALLPAGVQFVTAAWISSCLRTRQRCAARANCVVMTLWWRYNNVNGCREHHASVQVLTNPCKRQACTAV